MMRGALCLSLGLLGLALAAPAGPCPPAADQGDPGPVWLKDYNTAVKAAKASGKPMFIVFH